jgi:WD40 repeat protein
MKMLISNCLLFFVFTLSAQETNYLVQEFTPHSTAVKALAFSPSGDLLASGGEDKAIYVYNTATLQKTAAITDNYFAIADLEFYDENELFLTAGNDIKLVEITTNKKLALYEGNSTYLWSIDFAPERNKITAGSYDKKIKVWDVQTQQIDLVLEGHTKSTLPVVFSNDENYIVSGSLDLTIKVWNAQTGAIVHSLERHSDNIYDIAFHPDGEYFASASGDKTIRLWNIKTGNLIKTYSGHEGSVPDIGFSPDGYFLYSASTDGMVIVWEIASGKKLYSFIKHEGPVNAVAASSKGNLIATAGSDGKVYLWRSAEYIAVDTYFHDELENMKQQNSVFLPKQKNESKQEYIERQRKAEIELDKLVIELFEKYKQQVNYQTIPLQ